MSIVIKTKKVMVDGYKDLRRIEEVSALCFKKLPRAYLRQVPRCFIGSGERSPLVVVDGGGGFLLIPGAVVTEEYFLKAVEVIGAAGERLRQINMEAKNVIETLVI